MNDKELMLLAAKAGLLGGFEWNSCASASTSGFAGCVEYIPSGSVYYKKWRPLTDDGDALRLALAIRKYEPQINLFADGCCQVETLGELVQEDCAPDGDQCASLRRAIVRAAAEIGRKEIFMVQVAQNSAIVQ